MNLACALSVVDEGEQASFNRYSPHWEEKIRLGGRTPRFEFAPASHGIPTRHS
jgi:hypothetical protein